MKLSYALLFALACTLGGCATETDGDGSAKLCQDTGESYLCSQDELCCGGSCLAIDEKNCGSCGKACEKTKTCQNIGEGVWRCVCDGADVELASNPKHCGTCGNACVVGKACVDGKCVCPSTLLECGDLCVDYQTDPGNCGKCGNKCPDRSVTSLRLADSYCGSGECRIICEPGHQDRDGRLDNGCESANCGNGLVDLGEVCDGEMLNGRTCGTEILGSQGVLRCNADCRGFDTNGCTVTAETDCTAGTYQCVGKELQKCDGTGWKREEVCPGVCDEVQKQCVSSTPPCTAGTYQCVGKELQKCDGAVWKVEKTCPEVCDEVQKQCVSSTPPCTAGTYQCVGKELQKCDGTGWKKEEVCQKYCDEKLKKCLICKEDTDCQNGQTCNKSSNTCVSSGGTLETILKLEESFKTPDKGTNPSVSDTSHFAVRNVTGDSVKGINVGHWLTASSPTFDSKYIKISLPAELESKLAEKSTISVKLPHSKNGYLGDNAEIGIAFYSGTTMLGEPCTQPIKSKKKTDLEKDCSAPLTLKKALSIRIIAFKAASNSSGTLRIYPTVTFEAK